MVQPTTKLATALLLLALPLAGCTAPTVGTQDAVLPQGLLPPPSKDGRQAVGDARQAVAAEGTPVGDALGAARSAAADAAARTGAGGGPCPMVEERRTETRLGEAVITVEGCIAANEPLLAGGLPDDAATSFEVPAGTRHLTVVFHLHGKEPMRVALLDPQRQPVAWGRYRGDADRDTWASFDVASPRTGAWTVRGSIDDALAAGRAWTAVAVLVG